MNNIDLSMKQMIRDLNNSGDMENNMGKHIICNIFDIKKKDILIDLNKISDIMDIICKYNMYDAKQSMYNQRNEEDNGCSMIYLLNDIGQISIHTFPEKNSMTLDILTNYADDASLILIYEFLIESLEAGFYTSNYTIVKCD